MAFQVEKKDNPETYKTEHVERQKEINRLAFHFERTSFFAGFGSLFVVGFTVIITWVYDIKIKFSLDDFSVGMLAVSIIFEIIVFSSLMLGLYLYGVRQEAISQKEILLKRSKEGGFSLNSTESIVRKIFCSKYSLPDITGEAILVFVIFSNVGNSIITRAHFDYIENSFLMLGIIAVYFSRASMKKETDSEGSSEESNVIEKCNN